MTRPTRVDWVKAERFYRAGVIHVEAIAEKLGCTKQAIYRKAKENGWTRNLKSKIDKVTGAKLVNKPEGQLTGGEPVNKRGKPDEQSGAPPIVSAPVDAPDVHAREEEARDQAAAFHPSHEQEDAALVEAAAREIVSVTQAHRVEAARLIGIARDLGGKLADLVRGRAVAFEAKTKDGTKVRVAFLGDHESAADALGKVTRALKHLVDIERKAFAMDEPVDNPGSKRRDFVPLEERLATYRKEEAIAAADNVVTLPGPQGVPGAPPERGP